MISETLISRKYFMYKYKMQSFAVYTFPCSHYIIWYEKLTLFQDHVIIMFLENLSKRTTLNNTKYQNILNLECSNILSLDAIHKYILFQKYKVTLKDTFFNFSYKNERVIVECTLIFHTTSFTYYYFNLLKIKYHIARSSNTLHPNSYFLLLW